MFCDVSFCSLFGVVFVVRRLLRFGVLVVVLSLLFVALCSLSDSCYVVCVVRSLLMFA